MRLQVQEPITVIHSGGSSLPQAFTWRAKEHRVWKIEAVQDESVVLARGVVNRSLIQLRTHKGLRCSISYDGSRQRWRMETIHAGGGVR